MEKNKSEDVTKKLRNLVKNQKTPIVVFEKGSIKKKSSNSSDSSESYSAYSSSDDN